MSLFTLHQKLHWPKPEEILNPSGAGPQVIVRLVHDKLAVHVQKFADGQGAQLGILTGNPASNATAGTIAVICVFQNTISNTTLRETHKLAWNFCRTPLLVTVEPHLVRAWSSYEQPDPDQRLFHNEPVAELGVTESGLTSIQGQATTALDWIQLASGSFFSEHSDRFPLDQRADKTLLENLRFVRGKLMESVPEDVAHDLLARLIFIQFLFDRKDSKGNAALNESVLDGLHEDGTLSARYHTLAEILQRKSDTYAFFHWLDGKFNGDLFPGKGVSAQADESGWKREERCVTASLLRLLAQFVSGETEIRRGQRSLWPLYSFDTIPLEFISSIYEEFVSNDSGRSRGEHYTPAYAVDFMLDKVLPWGSDRWDLKILDPACGSGIFLVKAFQRLSHGWRNANPGREPTAAVLRNLLEQNIFGVDIEERAVRVASFSLYLAMCDEIDPRHYWSQVRFPRLRGVTLRAADFFAEETDLALCKNRETKFDLVVGNAPWGLQTLTEPARKWAADNDWETANEQIGTLFLPKAASVTKRTGRVCMIQPAGALLFNRSKPALAFRRKLFATYKVDDVVNLSALRFGLFPKAVGPACTVTLAPEPPDQEPLAYWCVKQHFTSETGHRFVIDARDLNWVYPEEAAEDPWVWTALAWGGRRDHELIHRLCDDPRHPTLKQALANESGWYSVEGFKRRRKAATPYSDRVGLHILEDHDLWEQCPIVCDVRRFPRNDDPLFERPRSLESYELPLLLVSLSWTVDKGRFKAALVQSRRKSDNALLFSHSFCGLRSSEMQALASLTSVLNSTLAVYFFFLSSGRLASYRPELLKTDLEQFPLPRLNTVSVQLLEGMSPEEIDHAAFDAYTLGELERTLVEDFFAVTLDDFKGDYNSAGRKPIQLEKSSGREKTLRDYCTSFMKVLSGGFGKDKALSATVFCLDKTLLVPFSLVAIHLDWPGRKPVVEEMVTDQAFHDKLYALEKSFLNANPGVASIFYQRVARVYQAVKDASGCVVPTVYLIKPNQLRYWTRSMALRDADEVAADLIVWGQPDTAKMEQEDTHA